MKEISLLYLALHPKTRRRQRGEQVNQTPDNESDAGDFDLSVPQSPSRSGSRSTTPGRSRSRGLGTRTRYLLSFPHSSTCSSVLTWPRISRSYQQNLRHTAAQNVQDLDQQQREVELRR
jgi:hypothetical protein